MIRFSLAFLALPATLGLVGCTTLGERASSGECPAGEVCSPLTPNGLHFIGNPMADEIFLSGPSATAIGGTQEIALEYERTNGSQIALDLPYVADDDGALGVKVLSQDDSVVTVGGQKSRSNYLRIVDPDTLELYDRYEIAGAAISEMSLVGTELEVVPAGSDLVWAPGDQTIGIALYGEVQSGSSPDLERIVDSSMALSLSGSERTGWDSLRLANATVGVHSLTVEAGELAPRALEVEVVAGADTIAVIGGQPTVRPGSSETVCFAATNAGRYIYGLTWQFNVDGDASTGGKQQAMRNCVRVEAPVGQTTGTIAVAAAAGGRQLNVDVEISTNAARRTDAGEPASASLTRSVPTAGDRARM